MKITQEWLTKKIADDNLIDWFKNQNKTDGLELAKKLILVNREWANWLIARLLGNTERVRYAIYAAEQVRVLFEKVQTNWYDGIASAKEWLKNKTRENANTAREAADFSSCPSVISVGNTVYSSESDTPYNAHDAASAIVSAFIAIDRFKIDPNIKEKIIGYGVSLLEESNNGEVR